VNEKKINILHLQNQLNISCGVSKTIFLIAKNTSSQFNHYVACIGGDGFSRFESINIKPIILKDYRNSLPGFVRHIIKIYSFCKQNEINIIHSHHRYFDLIAFLISQVLKIKTITSVQSKVYGKKYFSYKSDILIACSNLVKAHLINDFKIKERRIKVIYNSVDPKEVLLNKTKPELLNSLGIPADKFIIGYFGRLDFKDKGIDILLEAFLNLSKVDKDLFLLIIGNGTDEINVRSFITQNKLNTKVLNSNNDIFNYYQLLDVFVLPSRVDPFPLVMLEAGLMKKPFIGSTVDGIAELIEHDKDGLLIESENVEELTKCILRLINDSELADTLAENLNKKVIDNFLTSNMVSKYEHEYKKLLDPNVF
jgi:glycosyltransferase involved in cell wall biosynthesis